MPVCPSLQRPLYSRQRQEMQLLGLDISRGLLLVYDGYRAEVRARPGACVCMCACVCARPRAPAHVAAAAAAVPLAFAARECRAELTLTVRAHARVHACMTARPHGLQIYKISESNEAQAVQQFECSACTMAINNDSVYRSNDNRLEVLNLQGEEEAGRPWARMGGGGGLEARERTHSRERSMWRQGGGGGVRVGGGGGGVGGEGGAVPCRNPRCGAVRRVVAWLRRSLSCGCGLQACIPLRHDAHQDSA